MISSKTAIFGWCGSVKENKCLTMTYAIIMVILVVLEISAGITAFVKKDDVSRALVNIAQDSMNNYKQEVVRETWDTIQVFCIKQTNLSSIFMLKLK